MSDLENTTISVPPGSLPASDALGYNTLVRFMRHVEKIKNLDFPQQQSYASDFLLKVAQGPAYSKLRIDLASGFLLKRLIEINHRLKNEPDNPDMEDYCLYAAKLGADNESDLITQMARKWGKLSHSEGERRIVRQSSARKMIELFSDTANTAPGIVLKNFLANFADIMTDIRYKRKIRIEDFKAGKKEACNHIFSVLYRNLMQYATFAVGKENAYDLVADVLIRVWKEKDIFLNSSHLLKYSSVRLRYDVLNFHRDEEREQRNLAAYPNKMDITTFDPPAIDAIEEHEKKAFLHDTLHQGVAQLAKQESIIMTLLLEGKKPTEVANELGCNRATVDVTKSKCVQKLQNYFAERSKLIDSLRF
jgi:RNA polymerase sigma factor (sigma-70 family)